MSHEPSDDTDEHAQTGSARGPILRFILIFSILVMAMLTGYRYAINSELNMWYLYKVAQHTAWTLDVVGHSGAVEPHRDPHNAARLRRELDAWRRGEDPPETAAPAEGDAEVLSAWETWMHKAYARIDRGESIADHGPTIQFVERQGIRSKRSELKLQLQAARRDETLDPATSASRVHALEGRLAELDAAEAAAPEGEQRARLLNDRQFSFRIVPDCGAIPSMSIFFAAVAAFPALFTRKLWGLVLGLGVLYAVNIARLATLGYIGAVDLSPGKKWFSFIHEYVWQGIFLLFVVGVWMIWVETAARAKHE